MRCEAQSKVQVQANKINWQQTHLLQRMQQYLEQSRSPWGIQINATLENYEYLHKAFPFHSTQRIYSILQMTILYMKNYKNESRGAFLSSKERELKSFKNWNWKDLLIGTERKVVKKRGFGHHYFSFPCQMSLQTRFLELASFFVRITSLNIWKEDMKIQIHFWHTFPSCLSIHRNAINCEDALAVSQLSAKKYQDYW